MKKHLVLVICILLAAALFLGSATALTKYKAGEAYDFDPELANILKLNWYSSGENRALLTLLLAANLADNRVMGNADVLVGFVQNTSYVGRMYSDGQEIYAVVGYNNDYIIFILYAPATKQASFILQENTYGSTSSDYILESSISNLCTSYYKNESKDIQYAVDYILKVLDE